MKTRLLGAAILIALAVIFVPMFFSGSPVPANSEKNISLEIPPAPSSAQKPATAASADGPVITGPDQPAVAIPAQNQPASRYRETGPNVPAAIKPSPSAPVIPPERTAAAPSRKALPHKPQIPAQPPQPAAGTAKGSSNGHYLLNLSAYASTASAKDLVQKVQALGYPVAVSPLLSNGKTLAHVTAGPFASRNDAELARKQIVQAIPGVPARVEAAAAATAPAAHAATPSKPAATTPAASKSGHWAVQVAAVGSQADAVQLRDQLHSAGFPAYVDSVKGKSLWRVRVGPSTSRDDASKLLNQIQAKLKLNGNIVSSS